MANSNTKFLALISADARNEVLWHIANRYGISTQEAYDEIADERAEHLLDYMVEPHRSATSLLMKRYGVH